MVHEYIVNQSAEIILFLETIFSIAPLIENY